MASDGAGGDDAIKVFVRVRPLDADSNSLEFENNECLHVDSMSSITMLSKPEPKLFTFDRVAGPNTTQEEVFGVVGRRTVEACMQGYNGTIFAYGQTGSGKTFTMLGPSEDGQLSLKLRGVIPRSLEYLFSLISREQQKHGDLVQFLCKTSFLEIYNEQVYDLLDTASVGLHLRENIKRGVYVEGIVERQVASAKEAFDVLASGWSSRRVAATSMNRESSRSHAVFTLTIESKKKETAGGAAKIRSSQLHLVDLAGSERQRDTHAVGTRLKEAGNINRSLSTLGNVIMALVDIAHGKSRHVPYRDSKLTFLLRDSLGGNSRTFIIANVSMAAKCFGETLSTLSFARRAKMIRNKAVVNEDTTGNVLQLQIEIRKLREELNRLRGCTPLNVLPAPPQTPQKLSEQPSSEVLHRKAEDDRPTAQLQEMMMSAISARQAVEKEQQALEERVKKLEDVIEKKDKFLQSNKMILKFRETHITNLELRLRKSGNADLESLTLKLLQGEIGQLRQQLENNPETQRFALENLKLREDVRKLRALASDSEMAEEVSRLRQYCAQIEGQLLSTQSQRKAAAVATPKRRDRRSGVGGLDYEGLAADVDRFRQLNKQLQNELDSAKRQFEDKVSLARQREIELESQVVGFQQAKHDLEKENEALRKKGMVLGERHKHVLKLLTPTPDRKRSFGLESQGTPGLEGVRAALAFGSPAGLDDELPPDDLIEPDPDLVTETLTDEFKKIQDDNQALQEKIEALETLERRLRKENAELACTKTELEKTLRETRESSLRRDSEVAEEFSNQTEALNAAEKGRDQLRLEVRDLRLALMSSEKELQSFKSDVSRDAVSSSAALAQAQAEVTRLEGELSDFRKDHEIVVEDFQQMQSEMETLRDEALFKDSQLQQYEAHLSKFRDSTKVLEAQQQTLVERLEAEEEQNRKFSAQLQDGSNTHKQELVIALTECSELKNELAVVVKRSEDQMAELSSLRTQAIEAESQKDGLLRNLEQQKSDMASLMESLTEAKAQCSQKQNIVDKLRRELEDRDVELETVAADCKHLNEALVEAQQELISTKAELENRLKMQTAQLEMLNEDYEEMTEAFEQQGSELNSKTAEVKELTELRVSLANDIAALEEQLQQTQLDCQRRLSEVEAQTRLDNDNEILAALQVRENEVARLKAEEAVYVQKINRLESSQQMQVEELKKLHHDLETKWQPLEKEKEQMTSQLQALEYQLEAEQSRQEESEQNWKAKSSKMEEELHSAVQFKENAHRELNNLQSRLATLDEDHCLLQKSTSEQLQMMKEQLKRAQDLETKSFNEAQEARSSLEQLQEEKSKLDQKCIELEAQCQKLTNDNARLAGHQNSKQRIQHVVQMKREHQTLQEEIRRLNSLLKAKADRVNALEDALKKTMSMSPLGKGPSKENQIPS